MATKEDGLEMPIVGQFQDTVAYSLNHFCVRVNRLRLNIYRTITCFLQNSCVVTKKSLLFLISWIVLFPTCRKRDDTVVPTDPVVKQLPTYPVGIISPANYIREVKATLVETAQGAIAENLREEFFVPLRMTVTNTSIAELEKSREPSTCYEVYHDTLIRKMVYFGPGV